MEKYYKYKIENFITINKIITVHYFEFDKNFVSKGESHDFWEVVYADKEDIVCVADNKNITVKQGDILFHKPNEFHILKSNGKTAPNVFIISFDCKSKIMSFFENKKITLKAKDKNKIYTILEEAKRTFNIPISNPNTKKMELLYKPTLGGLQLIKNVLEILLIDLIRDLSESNGETKFFFSTGEYNNKLVNDIISLLEKNIYNRINIAKICDSTAYSRSLIFKQFKKHTGKTIIEYFNYLKIEKAKQLLRENQFSVKEISEKLNFDTPNYFSKKFKILVGNTPLKYKKLTSIQ